jgi:hypothetical protein
MAPWALESSRLCLSVQETLIKKIIYVEKEIQNKKKDLKDVKKQLGMKLDVPLTKDLSQHLKNRVKKYDSEIEGYNKLLLVLKSIGDSIAFIYLPKYDIKPLTFKESPGYLSGKDGFKLELKVFRDVFLLGSIAILNDITTCLRYGDITVVSQNKPPFLMEVKSSEIQNQRGKRQAVEAKGISDYLNSGQTLQNGWLVKRHLAQFIEENHRLSLNHLIENAINHGSAFEFVEDGLYYYVDTETGGGKLKDLAQIVKGSPIVISLNEYQFVPGYYPFILSINNPYALFEFYRQRLNILIIVDFDTIKQKLYSSGLDVKWENDDEWIFSISSTTGENREFGPMKVGHYYFGRVPYEFLSLEYFLREIIAGFRSPMVNEWTTPV